MRKTFSFLTLRELVSFWLSAIQEAKIKASRLRKAVRTLITINKVFVLLIFPEECFVPYDRLEGKQFLADATLMWVLWS